MSPCASASLPAMLGAGGAGVRQKNRSGARATGKVARSPTTSPQASPPRKDLSRSGCGQTGERKTFREL